MFLSFKKMGSSKDHFLAIPGSQKYFREYLRKNKNIFENILGYCSRAQVLSIHAKNQSSKISCYSPFKQHTLSGPCTLAHRSERNKKEGQNFVWHQVHM